MPDSDLGNSIYPKSSNRLGFGGWLIVGAFLSLIAWVIIATPKSIKLRNIPEDYRGLWRNASYRTNPPDYLIITEKEIEESSGRSLAQHPVLSVTSRGEDLIHLIIVCRNGPNGFRTFEIVRKGEALIHVTEKVPTGYDDQTGYFPLGFYYLDTSRFDPDAYLRGTSKPAPELNEFGDPVER